MKTCNLHSRKELHVKHNKLGLREARAGRHALAPGAGPRRGRVLQRAGLLRLHRLRRAVRVALRLGSGGWRLPFRAEVREHQPWFSLTLR